MRSLKVVWFLINYKDFVSRQVSLLKQRIVFFGKATRYTNRNWQIYNKSSKLPQSTTVTTPNTGFAG